jgi:hypothetical protein
MSINLEVEDLKRNFHSSYDFPFKEELYGKYLGKDTYFAMFKGLIPPKICEIVAYSRAILPAKQTMIPYEENYVKMNAYLNNEAAKHIDDSHNEEHKSENEVSSTSAESMAQIGNETVEPEIARLLNSDVFFEKIEGSSGDLRNTIRL